MLAFMQDIPSIMTFLGILVAIFQSRQNGKVAKQNLAAIQETHATVSEVKQQTNGVVATLVVQAKEAGRAEAQQEERDRK